MALVLQDQFGSGAVAIAKRTGFTLSDLTNKYYLSSSSHGYDKQYVGYNKARSGAAGWQYTTELDVSVNKNRGYSAGTVTVKNTVLPNCVGYMAGRFYEMASRHPFDKTNCCLWGNPGQTWRRATGIQWDTGEYRASWQELKDDNGKAFTVSQTPRAGAIMVWRRIKDVSYWYQGHVAIVEEVLSNGDVIYSQSAFQNTEKWKSCPINTDRGKKSNNYKYSNSHEFMGFIYNPWVNDIDGKPYRYSSDSSRNDITNNNDDNQNYSGGPVSEEKATEITGKTFTITYNKSKLNTVDQYVGEGKHVSLMTYPTMIQSPFIILEMAGVTFGSYSKKDLGNGQYQVKYPNYVNSLVVDKIAGAFNTYTIKLIYAIEAGNDPNLIDKIISKVGYGGKIYIKYGDWMAPSFVFGEEEAIITNVKSSVNFSNSKIEYTISATSTALNLISSVHDFDPYKNTKPSSVIRELFTNNTYNILDIFTGMKKSSALDKLIPTNDKLIDIPAKKSMDVLSYINWLVTLMVRDTNVGDSVIRDSSYYVTIHDTTIYDDVTNNYGGCYLKITCVDAGASGTFYNEGVYEIDIGYPSDNYVSSFSVNSDSSWALLYKYTEDNISTNDYTYKLNDDGSMSREWSPGVSRSSTKFRTTEEQRSWWTKMTQFPITGDLTIQGLLRPILLMTPLKINTYFYGQKYTASGIYLIKSQKDTISGSGYKTALTLQRIAGDYDYYTTETVTETRKAVYYKGSSTSSSSSSSSSSTGGDYITYDNNGEANAANDCKYVIKAGTKLYHKDRTSDFIIGVSEAKYNFYIYDSNSTGRNSTYGHLEAKSPIEGYVINNYSEGDYFQTIQVDNNLRYYSIILVSSTDKTQYDCYYVATSDLLLNESYNKN